MKIEISKQTPYRKGIEREIKIGEVHEVSSVRSLLGCLQSKAYYFTVDGRERIALESDCNVI